MKIDVLTLFPAMFAGPLDESIIKRARQAGLLDLQLHQLRDWTHDRHKTVDDRPFGGGPGMLLKPEPIFEAVESLQREKTRVILMSPSGRKFDQAIARELDQQEHLLIVTGHYEGFDERIREALADDELSIGDYVLTNGALPAMGRRFTNCGSIRRMSARSLAAKGRRSTRSAPSCWLVAPKRVCVVRWRLWKTNRPGRQVNIFGAQPPMRELRST